MPNRRRVDTSTLRAGLPIPCGAPPRDNAPSDGANDRQRSQDVEQLQRAVAAVRGDAEYPFDEIHAAFSSRLSRDRSDPYTAVARRAEQFAILSMEQQVYRHCVRQAIGEWVPAGP